MRDGIVYDCLCANCKTPLYTGKCRNDCIEKHNKEMGVKTKTNADRIRAMTDEELANMLTDFSNNGGWVTETGREICYERHIKWLKQPAEVE